MAILHIYFNNQFKQSVKCPTRLMTTLETVRNWIMSIGYVVDSPDDITIFCTDDNLTLPIANETGLLDKKEYNCHIKSINMNLTTTPSPGKSSTYVFHVSICFIQIIFHVFAATTSGISSTPLSNMFANFIPTTPSPGKSST